MTRIVAVLAGVAIIIAAIGLTRDVQALGLGRLGSGFGRMGSVGATPGTPAPPSSCNGTIDLSTGCVMPMLR